jgi:hypothetical protein
MKKLSNASLVSVLLVALAAHPYAPIIALILLAIWSLRGAKEAIQALSLTVIIKFLNPAIYHFAGPFALVAWIVLAIAGLRIFLDNLRIKSRRHPVIPWLLLFSSMLLVESLFFSRYSIVYIFKVTSFCGTSFMILSLTDSAIIYRILSV